MAPAQNGARLAAVASTFKSNSSDSRKHRRAEIVTSSNRRFPFNLDNSYTGSIIVTNQYVLGKAKRLTS